MSDKLNKKFPKPLTADPENISAKVASGDSMVYSFTLIDPS